MTRSNTDHHFPRFHVRPHRGFVNDPNGPVVIDGVVHLYFQYRPATAGHSFVTWGHATSVDFVRWRHHRLAVTPEGDGPDRDGAWSGCTVLDAGRLVAFYSAFDMTAKYQSVVSAVSTDGGFSFGPGKQVVPDPEPIEKLVYFRDPFVWRDGALWRMVVGAGGIDGTASARVYESHDLETWTAVGIMAQLAQRESGLGDTGVMWECPQVVNVGGIEVLIVCPWSPNSELRQVLTLTQPADRHEALPTIGRLDEGTNFYAASVMRSSSFGPLVWGWATEARSVDWCAEVDWSGMITLPRVLSLRADGTVASAPLPAMSLLRTKELEVAAPRPGELNVAGVPAQVEIRLSLPARTRAKLVTVRMRFSMDEYLEIAIDRRSGLVVFDVSHASTDARATSQHFSMNIERDDSESGFMFVMYVDGSILELFTGSGRCATVRMYPTAPPPWTLDIEGDLIGANLRCWSLEEIHS